MKKFLFLLASFSIIGFTAVYAFSGTVSVDLKGNAINGGSGEFVVFGGSGDGQDPGEGFPDNERDLAQFVRGAQSSVQRIPFQDHSGGGGIGDPTNDPNRWVDLQSPEVVARANQPSDSFELSSIVSGNGPADAPNDRGDNGVFHVACTVSHFAYDDPIALPGKPGQAHLHMFFGNTRTNAYSTSDSILNNGNGSCQHEELNRTAYWVPALIDGDHHVLRPEYIQVYYESFGNKRQRELVNYPEGLNFISGNAFATEPQPAWTVGGRSAVFFCGWYGSASVNGQPPGDSAFKQSTIPYCDPEKYSHLQMNLASAYCWDGENLDWSKDSPNVVYPPNSYYGTCPASHPVMLPGLLYRLNFNIRENPTSTADWYLSSDVDRATGNLIAEPGTTMHADWWNGWNQELLDTVFDNCINKFNFWCGPVHLGDGRLTDHIGKIKGVDDRRLSPEEVLTLCPQRSEFDGNKRNIAYCNN